MSEGIQISNVAGVPEDVHQSLLADGSGVETKVGHVAKFHPDEKKNDLEEHIVGDDRVYYKKKKENNEFIGLSKEVKYFKMKSFINFLLKGIKSIYK